MYLAARVSEDLLWRLRLGAQKLVLAIAIESGEEWEGEQSSRFCRLTRLLDAIGWHPGEAGPEVGIDIADHALALHEALVRALRDALFEQRAAEHGQHHTGVREFAELVGAAGREHARQDIRLRRLSEQAEALLADLAGQSAAYDPFDAANAIDGDEFERAHRDPCLWRLREAALALMDELDREQAEYACRATGRLRGRFASLSFLRTAARRRTRGGTTV